jgi:hypothetical protein
MVALMASITGSIRARIGGGSRLSWEEPPPQIKGL